MLESKEAQSAAPAAYRSQVRVRRVGGPDKAVQLPAERDEVVMGVHDEIARFVGAPDHPPHAATLDYVVGATAACMAGTFARALAARGVDLASEDHAVEATGLINERDKVLVLERITVRHRVRLPEQHHEQARRVHGFYHRACQVSRSLEGAIEIESELELV